MQRLGFTTLRQNNGSGPEVPASTVDAEIVAPDTLDVGSDEWIQVAKYLAATLQGETYMAKQNFWALAIRLERGVTTLLTVPRGQERIIVSMCSMVPIFGDANFVRLSRATDEVVKGMPKPMTQDGPEGVHRSAQRRPNFDLRSLEQFVGKIVEIATGRTEPLYRGQHAWSTLAGVHVRDILRRIPGAIIYGVFHPDNTAIVGPLDKAGIKKVITPEEQRMLFPFVTAFLSLCPFEPELGEKNPEGKLFASLRAGDDMGTEDAFFKPRLIAVNDVEALKDLEAALRAEFKEIRHLVHALLLLRIESHARVAGDFPQILPYLIEVQDPIVI